MPVVRRSHALRSLIAVASAALVLPLLPGAVASAEDDVPAGGTVVGEVVQA